MTLTVLDFVEIGVVLGTIIWAVAKIKTTADVLNVTVNSLKDSVKSLERTVEGMRSDQSHHASRITRLETINNVGRKSES